MAIGYYFQPHGMTRDQYDEVIRKLDEAGAGSPPGRTWHCAFEVANEIHVFDIWESEEQFNAFGETLMPIVEAVGVDPGQPTVSPIHNVIRG
jgi:hypothetical protein